MHRKQLEAALGEKLATSLLAPPAAAISAPEAVTVISAEEQVLSPQPSSQQGTAHAGMLQYLPATILRLKVAADLLVSTSCDQPSLQFIDVARI